MHRRATLLSFALLFLASLLNAQAVPSFSSQTLSQPEVHSTVSGHIICADTNRPARSARVNLLRIPDGSNQQRSISANTNATSDIDGAFSIQGVVAGSYYVQVMTPGYIDPLNASPTLQWQNQAPAIQAQLRTLVPNVTVNGKDSASIDIRLERGGAISGNITYDDGSPATSITVHLESVDRNKGRIVSASMNGFQATDDTGHFRLSGLPSGDYYVVAQFVTYRPAISTINTSQGPQTRHTQAVSSSPVYAPGKFTRSDASPVHITAGDEQKGISITIPLHGMHTIRGSVVLVGSGNPVEAGSVTLTDERDHTFQRSSLISQDGSIQFDMVPSGTYILRVTGAFERQRYPPPVVINGQPQALTPPPAPHRYGTTTMSITVGNNDVDNAVLQVPEEPETKQTQPSGNIPRHIGIIVN